MILQTFSSPCIVTWISHKKHWSRTTRIIWSTTLNENVTPKTWNILTLLNVNVLIGIFTEIDIKNSCIIFSIFGISCVRRRRGLRLNCPPINDRTNKIINKFYLFRKINMQMNKNPSTYSMNCHLDLIDHCHHPQIVNYHR